MALAFSLGRNPYPIPGIVPVYLKGYTGDFVRIWVTAAPDGSRYRRKLDAQTYTARAEVYAGGMIDIWKADLDVGGKYTFTAQEYTQIASSFGGGYQGDPDSWSSETQVGSEVSLSIYVGERLTHRLGTPDYGYADLVLWVWNDAIRQTTKQVHGETTPAVLNPTTEKAEVAAYSTTLLATVATLVNTTATALITNLSTLIGEMRTDIPLHMNNNGGAWHGAVDDQNDTEIETLPATASTPEGYALSARVLAQRLAAHMEDSAGTWHTTGSRYGDLGNALITPIPSGASNMSSVWAAIADVYRAYEAHRSYNGHSATDSSNPLGTSLPLIVQIHRDFLAAMQPMNPTAPPAANSATTVLAQWGFERS